MLVSTRSIRSRAVALVMAGASLAPGFAHAAEVSALWGRGNHSQNFTLAYQTGPFWSRQLSASGLDASLELSAGQARADHASTDRSLWHVGLTPVVRWWFEPSTALEAGIGANVFSGTRLGSKNISTAFQFGDFIGVMHHFEHSPWIVGLRFTHYSNADIKRPNPGQDYLQLRVSYDLP